MKIDSKDLEKWFIKIREPYQAEMDTWEVIELIRLYVKEQTEVKNLVQPDVIREVCECESDYLQCNEFGKCPQCGKDWR